KGAVLRYHRLRREDLQKPCSTGMPRVRERAETIFGCAATQPEVAYGLRCGCGIVSTPAACARRRTCQIRGEGADVDASDEYGAASRAGAAGTRAATRARGHGR